MSPKARALGSLRLRIGIAVLASVGAFATFVVWYSAKTLAASYAEAGRSDTFAIARTFSNQVDAASLRNRATLESRLTRLQDVNPQILKATIYGRENGENLRLASTDRSELGKPVEAHDLGPIASGRYDYAEERKEGEHVAELNYPVGYQGHPAAVLGLYYNLGPLDTALAQRKRDLAVAGGSTALLLTLLLTVTFGRSVFRPLHRLRLATNRLADGELSTRLEWDRDDELGVLARDFDQMAASLADNRERLEALALEDPLTGIPNHRAFQERLSAELARADREGYDVAVVGFDIDRFKAVNDHLGHAVGDEALRILARTVTTVIRPSDVCGRVGGDEFVLILPRAGADAAACVVRRVREAIGQIPIGDRDEHITISAGIAEYPRHASEQSELLRLADGALYQAKREGRDRCFVYSSVMEDLSPAEEAERAHKTGLLNTIHALARAVDAKDGYTHLHSSRVALYAATLAAGLGFDDQAIRVVRTAGVLHDVGKIGISDAILLKRGELTDDEYEEIKRHSELAKDIIGGAGMPEVATWVAHLHERFDGLGYPSRLKGHEIPLESRILAAADALEAMTSSRLYRSAMTVEEALAELESCAGTQFDPEVVTTLVALVRSGELVIQTDEQRAQTAPQPMRDAPPARPLVAHSN